MQNTSFSKIMKQFTRVSRCCVDLASGRGEDHWWRSPGCSLYTPAVLSPAFASHPTELLGPQVSHSQGSSCCSIFSWGWKALPAAIQAQHAVTPTRSEESCSFFLQVPSYFTHLTGTIRMGRSTSETIPHKITDTRHLSLTTNPGYWVLWWTSVQICQFGTICQIQIQLAPLTKLSLFPFHL